MSYTCQTCRQTFNKKAHASCSRCKGAKDTLSQAAHRIMGRGFTPSPTDQSKLGDRFDDPKG